MTFLQKSTLTLLMRAGIFILSFLLQVWISRALGPAGKGAYAIFTLVPALVAQLASLGIYNAYIFLIGQNKADFKAAAENALAFSFVASVVLLGGYAAARPWFDAVIFKTLAPEITAWFFCALPVNFLFLAFNYLALARDDLLGYNLPNLARPALMLLGLAILFLFDEIDLFNTIAVWVAVSLLLALQSWWLIFRREKFGWGWHAGLFRESVKLGWRSHLGTIFYYLGWRLDFMLCNIYLDARAVGQYSIAVLVGEVLWFIPNTLGVVLLPQTSRADKERSETLAAQVCRLTFFSSMVLALALALTAPYLVRLLFGEAFLPAVPALQLLLPGMIMESGTRILTSFFVGRGFPLTTSTSAALVAVSNLMMNLCCIPRYGIAGAAVAGTISYTLGAAYLIRAFQRLTGIPYLKILMLQGSDLDLLRQIWLRFQNAISHEPKSR